MRRKIDISDNWLFYIDDPINGVKKTDLPYSWLPYGVDEASINLYPDHGVFVKEIEVDPSDGEDVWIELSAVSEKCDLSVNGKHVGSHIGGVTKFRFDLTRFVKKSKKLLISLSVSAIDSGFMPFVARSRCGVFGKINLIYAPHSHFALDDFGSDGVFVNTALIDGSKAEINVNAVINNPINYDVVLFVLYAPDGSLCGEALAHPKSAKAKIILDDPLLWEASGMAYMYKLTAAIVRDGIVSDSVDVEFGIKDCGIDKEGFFSSPQLDHAPLTGFTYNRDIWNSQIDPEDDVYSAMNELYAGCVKLGSDVPTDDNIWDMADADGLVVWSDFSPLTTFADADSDEYKLFLIQLTEYVKQTCNHPCAVFRSVYSYFDYHTIDKYSSEISQTSLLIKTLAPSSITACTLRSDDIDVATETIADVLCIQIPFEKGAVNNNIVSAWVDEYRTYFPDYFLSVICAPCAGSADDSFLQAEYHEAFWREVDNKEGVFAVFIDSICDRTFSGSDDEKKGGLTDVSGKKKKTAYDFYRCQLDSTEWISVAGVVRSDEDKTVSVKVYSNCGKPVLTQNGKDKKYTASSGGKGVYWFRGIKLTRGINRFEFISEVNSATLTLIR